MKFKSSLTSLFLIISCSVFAQTKGNQTKENWKYAPRERKGTGNEYLDNPRKTPPPAPKTNSSPLKVKVESYNKGGGKRENKVSAGATKAF